MKFVLGLIIGGLIVAYNPSVVDDIRVWINTAADRVAEHTEPTAVEQFKDTIDDLSR